VDGSVGAAIRRSVRIRAVTRVTERAAAVNRRPWRRLTRQARVLFVLPLAWCVVGLANRPPQNGPGEDEMPLRGGTVRLLRAAGIRAPLEPSRAFLALVRTLHGALPARAAGPRTAGLLSDLKAMSLRAEGLPAISTDKGGEAEFLPTLLPPTSWEQAVFGRRVPLETLAPAILADRGAALLYYGLFALDEKTLAFFAGHPSLVASIARDPAAFAAFADGIVVHDGRMVLPGGAPLAALWEDLAGAPPNDPERFIERLLQRDEGRLAWFLNAVSGLDGDHQALACLHLSQLYETFSTFDRTAWSIPRAPFTRWSVVDPEFVLQRLAVAPGGGLAPPRDRGLWRRVFEGPGPVLADPTPVTAPWLVRQIVSANPKMRRARLDTVLFAQRVFAKIPRGGAAIASETALALASAFAGREALMTKLEAMGFTEADDWLAALGAAAVLTADSDARRASQRLAMFQAMLTVIARLAEVGTIGSPGARDLARSLFAQNPSDAVEYPHAIARLVESILERSASAGQDAAGDAETRLLDALAGLPVERSMPTVEWEGRRYRVDIRAAERTRLGRIRRKQGGIDLQTALDVHRLASGLIDPASSRETVQRLSTSLLEAHSGLRGCDARALFGFDVRPALEGLRTAAVELGDGRADRKSAEVARRLADGLAVLLAEALTSHVYALAIGDPDTPMLLADNPACRHDFGLDLRPGEPGPWSIAAGTHRGSGAAVVGSLVALDRALASRWLRPTTMNAPDLPPTLTGEDVEGFGESVAALNAFRLTDRARDTISGALRRGRERLAAASADEADAMAASLGVDGWRRRLIRQAIRGDAGDAGQYMSLGEVMRLGLAGAPPAELEGWGLPRRAIDGSLGTAVPGRLAWRELTGRPGGGLMAAQVPDLQLRVVEWLADLGLPAGLAPGILAYATWDLASGAQMADFDDWLSVIGAAQALPADRMENYVSAMVADGALVDVEGKSRK